MANNNFDYTFLAISDQLVTLLIGAFRVEDVMACTSFFLIFYKITAIGHFVFLILTKISNGCVQYEFIMSIGRIYAKHKPVVCGSRDQNHNIPEI